MVTPYITQEHFDRVFPKTQEKRMYSYKRSRYGKHYWIYDPNGVIICPIEDEGHAVVLVNHLNRAV